MNTPTPPSSPIDAARALLKTFQESYPVFGECQPLAIGIDKQIRAQKPDVDKKALRVALSLHTNSLRYLKTMEKGTTRFNLDGTPAGEIEQAHRDRAAEILRERYKKSAERKKAQQEAEKAERQRTEKLQRLAEKFTPRR